MFDMSFYYFFLPSILVIIASIPHEEIFSLPIVRTHCIGSEIEICDSFEPSQWQFDNILHRIHVSRSISPLTVSETFTNSTSYHFSFSSISISICMIFIMIAFHVEYYLGRTVFQTFQLTCYLTLFYVSWQVSKCSWTCEFYSISYLETKENEYGYNSRSRRP